MKNGGEAVTPEWIGAGRYALGVDGTAVPAVAHIRSPYDPDRRRVLV